MVMINSIQQLKNDLQLCRLYCESPAHPHRCYELFGFHDILAEKPLLKLSTLSQRNNK